MRDTILFAEPGLELGDRFETSLTAEARHAGRLVLPETLRDLAVPVEVVEDENGNPHPASRDADGTGLVIPGWTPSPPAGCVAMWLEYRGPGRFLLVAEQALSPADGEVTTEQGVHVAFDPEDRLLVCGVPQAATLPEWELGMRAARLATHAGFDRLICLPLVRDMELLEHQIRTAKTVLRRFRGRALLCDEVGLGKTIEAGLVLDELHLRGLARSVLILVPPSLIEQ